MTWGLASDRAWNGGRVRGAVASIVVLAMGVGCGTGGGEDADGLADTSAGGAESTGASAGGDGAGEGPVGDTDGTGPGATSTSGLPAQCEGADDGWGSGGDETGGDDGDGDGSGGGTFGMDDDMPLATNVYDVQMGAVPPGELVSLAGLVATTPAVPSETGTGWEMFVQEPTGGPYSGIRVRTSGFDPSALVAVGDEVSLEGRLRVQDGFYLVEIEGSSAGLTAGDPITPPEPDVVPAEMLEPTNPDARQYEGVPVRVEMVVVLDADPCEGEVAVGQALRVDDRFVPQGLPELAEGAVIVAVEGVLVYALDAYELAPTSAEDLQ